MGSPGLALRDEVTKVLPRISANAAATEQARSVHPENVALLRATGFLNAFQPALFGGLEVDIHTYGTILIDIAEACGSTAWAMGLLAQHSHMIGLMSPEAQHEIWDDNPDALASSSVAPFGTAEPVNGGVRLSGRFGWSSGCDHATWAILGFPQPDPLMGGKTGSHLAMVPLADGNTPGYTIDDDWQVAGLRGTGSKTLVVDDVFVPHYRIESLWGLRVGQSQGYGWHPGDIFCSSFSHYFACGFAATALGVARRLLDVYTERTKTRVRAYTGANVGEGAPAAMHLAESYHQLFGARSSLEADWRAIAARSRSGELPTPDEMAHWRANQAYVTKQAIAAADRLFTASGGTVWFDDQEMQRLWRDVKMTGAHTYSDYDVATQRHGRHLLGLEIDPALF